LCLVQLSTGSQRTVEWSAQFACYSQQNPLPPPPSPAHIRRSDREGPSIPRIWASRVSEYKTSRSRQTTSLQASWQLSLHLGGVASDCITHLACQLSLDPLPQTPKMVSLQKTLVSVSRAAARSQSQFRRSALPIVSLPYSRRLSSTMSVPKVQSILSHTACCPALPRRRLTRSLSSSETRPSSSRAWPMSMASGCQQSLARRLMSMVCQK